MTTTKSEILKAAHRQAKRLVCPGFTYRQALARAMSEMYAFARKPKTKRSAGLQAALQHVLPQWGC